MEIFGSPLFWVSVVLALVNQAYGYWMGYTASKRASKRKL